MQPVSGNARGIKVALVALTFSTGLIDALSFIALEHVFTANMTGNVVFLAFALGGVNPGLQAENCLLEPLRASEEWWTRVVLESDEERAERNDKGVEAP